MHSVRLPAIASTALAPVSLIGGWWLEAQAAPGYDPVRQTISELAARGMPTYFAMNLVFVLTGCCHLLTAGYTPGLPRLARWLLAAAGLAIAAVAAVPLESVDAIDPRHRAVGVLALLLPGIWPLAAARHGDRSLVPTKWLWLLGAGQLALTVGFFAVWDSQIGWTGFAERCAAGLGVLIPTITVHRMWWLQLQPRTASIGRTV